MKSDISLTLLAEVTAHQWGMVTAAQAALRGVTRLDLSRLAKAGHLERLAHGVYKDSGVPDDPFDDLRAAWLSTNPKLMAEARIKDLSDEVVVAGVSAARLHEVGDLWEERHDFVTPTRRQTQRSEIRYRVRKLDPKDVTLVKGLPVMTVERTIADLVEELGDLGLVADALRDAVMERGVSLGRLRSLLAPLAERNGFKKADGNALLDRLLEIAGIDKNSVAQQLAADPSIGPLVLSKYLGGLNRADAKNLEMTPELAKAIQKMMEPIWESLSKFLAVKTGVPNAQVESLTREAAVEIGNSLREATTLKSETLEAFRLALRTTANDRI